MYTLRDYGAMIADPVRMEAYERALEMVVHPGSVVLDVGTGVGMWAMLACRFGALKVYAIEPAEIIQVARELAAANGFADRIEFVQDLSTRITLPEPVDVAVATVEGVLPFFGLSVVSIIDARRRHLKPGGVLLPTRQTVWAAPVESPRDHLRYMSIWEQACYGIDLSAVRRRAANHWDRASRKLRLEDLLAPPQCWAEIDYTEVESADVSGTIRWEVQRAGYGHGLCQWFDSTLIDGVGFSNAPGRPDLIYGRAFFPWPEAVALDEGDLVQCEIRALFSGSGYIWVWNTKAVGRDGSVKAEFRQSDAFAEPVSVETLGRLRSDYVPELSEDGRIDRFILECMNGSESLETIACQLQENFPRRFATIYEALTRVGELSQKYSG